LEGRKPIKLLPRSVDTPTNENTEKNSSIFGSGKPRDINQPEIKQLEERLEQTIISSRQEAAAAAAAASAAGDENHGEDSNGEQSPTKNDRLRTTSTASSTHSNAKK
jgi:septal ring factor EnvC (AmiA/AmiB activator)